MNVVRHSPLFNAHDLPAQLFSYSLNTLDALVPVQLPPEDFDKFKAAFHARKRRKQDAPGKKFSDLAVYLSHVSAYLNAVLDGLRDSYRLIPYWQTSGEDVGKAISVRIAEHYNPQGDDKGMEAFAATIADKSLSFLGSMCTGRHHIVVDSARYPGGKDILYVGTRGAGQYPTLCVNKSDTTELPEFTNQFAYGQLQSNGHIDNKVNQYVVDLVRDLLEYFTGSQMGHQDIYLRSTKQLSITAHIFEQIIKIVNKSKLVKSGVVLTLPKFSAALNAASAQKLVDYTSILALYEPSANIVAARMKHTGSDETFPVALDTATLQASVCFSFAVNLPENFVRYIAQAQSNEKPSLASVNTWSTAWSASMLRPKGMRGGIPPAKAPMYVIPPSKAPEISKRRAALGLFTEPGRINEDGLYINARGDLNWLPPASESNLANAQAYEKQLEHALQLSFDAGTPLAASQIGSTDKLFDLTHPEYGQEIRKVKEELAKYQGSVQSYSWDLNSVISVSATDPGRVVSSKLTGATRPNELNMATYMRGPFPAMMASMFSRARVSDSGASKLAESKNFEIYEATEIEKLSVFTNFASFYRKAVEMKLVPSLPDLISQAAQAFKIKSLSDEVVKDFEISRLNSATTIYKNVLSPDLKLLGVYSEPEMCGDAIIKLLEAAMSDASCGHTSNLAAYCLTNKEEPEEDPHFFRSTQSTLAEFSNVYNYFGGRVAYLAMKAVAAIKPTDLQTRYPHKADEPVVSFTAIMTEVLPFAHMMSKYIVDRRDEIYAKADEIIDTNRNPKKSETELRIPGSRAPTKTKPGMQLFPHQAEALRLLANHPRIAILDIAPGGGKTIIGLSDMAMLMQDNLVKGPFYVICPNGLVKNWVEDMHKVTEGKWNVIPITTETYNSWGDEKLTEMIQKAPRNTIVVVGNSFLSSTGKSQLVIGNAVERVSNSIEFIKKFRPEYVIIDESHRIRNTESSLHQAVKTINTMSSVKYGRIATGTLIQNVMSDVVGQSAIYSAQMFRSKEEFDKSNKVYVEGPDGQPQLDYAPDVPKKARERLSEFATVISYKRKEWAFMLPQPIETFIRVKMEDEKLGGEDKIGHAHRMFYDAVLTRTMEELRQDTLIKKLTSGKGDDDNDEDDDGDDDKPASKKSAGETAMAGGKKIDVSATDDDGDNLDALEAALQPYLQRLERILTDPLGDPDLAEVAEKFFGSNVKRSGVVTAKVAKIIERIKFHFTKIPWKKGGKYRSSDMCDYNGETYILRADEPVGKSEYVSIKTPDEDSDNWKPQARGKVLVFCRYTRSVEAIYRALPSEFKKRAVVFHGEVEGDKWENLDQFKEDPAIDILIANEMGISEGHNLQMASRFIRAESPWSPGELDQSSSRIFRPDVEGKYKRQTIFLDWIVTDGSLEVAKMGRLISKMLKKTQFDELYNPKYYKGLNPRNLPVIRMTLENIENLNSLGDLCAMGGEGHMGDIHPDSYIGQYQFLVSEQAAEFREMRKTKRAYMIDVEPTPMPEDARIVEYTPWVANMKVPDRNNDGLVSLNGILREEDNPLTKAIAADKDAIVGKYVRTEFGVGKVKGYTSRRGKADAGEDGEDEGANGYSKLRVALAQGGVVLVGASKVFIANNVTDRSAKSAVKGAPKFTDKDKRQTKRNEEAVEEATTRESRRSARTRRSIEDDAKRSRDAEPEQAPQEEIVELHAAVYNRFLALEAITPDEGDTYLKEFGFSKFGAYAYIPVKNEDQYNDILDWLEDKFTLDRKTEKYLEAMLEAFSTGRGRKFNVELAPTAEMPHFLQTRHRLTKVANSRKPDLKVYPLIVHSSFFLAVDLASNPVFRRYVGKTVPHSSPAAKINEADGMDVIFVKTKGELVRKVKEVRDAGISITNYDEIKAEIKALSVKVAAV